MSKKFGIASKLLGKPKENEEFVKNKVNCYGQPDPNSPISSLSYEVLYPRGKAVDDNVIPIAGGCIVKLGLEKEIDSTLDKIQKDKFTRFVNGVALDKVKDQFNVKVENPTDYFKKVVLKTNKLLLNVTEQSKDLEEVGSYYISGYKSNNQDQDVRNYLDFMTYLELSTTKNRRIKRLFRFGFVPFKVLTSLVDQTADLASSINYKVLDVIDPKLIKDALNSIDTYNEKEKDEIIRDALSFVCPIHKLSVNDVQSSDDTEEQIGYFTYYEKNLYFVIPDMSLEDSNGASPNFYNLGETKDSFRFYMAFEAILFGQISYMPISYVPPPCPLLVDNVLEEIQSSNSFALDISKEGLIGGTTLHFAKYRSTKFSDYKIILSPVSSKSVSYFNLGISKADNNDTFLTPTLLVVPT